MPFALVRLKPTREQAMGQAQLVLQNLKEKNQIAEAEAAPEPVCASCNADQPVTALGGTAIAEAKSVTPAGMSRKGRPGRAGRSRLHRPEIRRGSDPGLVLVVVDAHHLALREAGERRDGEGRALAPNEDGGVSAICTLWSVLFNKLQKNNHSDQCAKDDHQHGIPGYSNRPLRHTGRNSTRSSDVL